MSPAPPLPPLRARSSLDIFIYLAFIAVHLDMYFDCSFGVGLIVAHHPVLAPKVGIREQVGTY